MTDKMTLGEAAAIWERNRMPRPKGIGWMDAMLKGAEALLALEGKLEAARATAFESAAKLADKEAQAALSAIQSGEFNNLSHDELYAGQIMAQFIAGKIRALAAQQPGAAQGESDEQVGQVSTQQYADDFALMLLCRTSSEHVNGTHRIYNSDARDAADYLSERGFVEVKGDIFRWTDKFLEHVAGRSTVARLVGGRGDDEND